jgi:hypothetical protein
MEMLGATELNSPTGSQTRTDAGLRTENDMEKLGSTESKSSNGWQTRTDAGLRTG